MFETIPDLITIRLIPASIATTSTTEGATSTPDTASTKAMAPASTTNSCPAARGGHVGGGDVERQGVWYVRGVDVGLGDAVGATVSWRVEDGAFLVVVINAVALRARHELREIGVRTEPRNRDAAQWNGERKGRRHEMGLDAGINVLVVRDGRDGDAVRSDGMAVVVSPDPFANGACGDVREVERNSEDEGALRY